MFLIIWWLKIENKEGKKIKEESTTHWINILICEDRYSHEINNIYEDFIKIYYFGMSYLKHLV